MAVARPVAVLKMTWSDAPRDEAGPVGLPYDDALVNRRYLPLEEDWGVSGYRRRGTYACSTSRAARWRTPARAPRR